VNLALAAFPEGTRKHLRTLFAEPLLEPSALRGQVDTHLRLLREAFLTNPDIAQELATQLTESCLGLLWMSREGTALETRRLVQVATHYFTLSEDRDGDFSRGGLNDDREVLNIICQHLDREDLIVD
jgi:hypothetical protein